MIRIAICDDTESDIEQIKIHINRYATNEALKVSVKAFTKKEDILFALDHYNDYDIFFLDIYMESLNGIELAKTLKKQGIKSRIIFFSTSMDHFRDAFGVNAIQYLIKPVKYDDFANAMKLALTEKTHRDEAISIQCGVEVVKILFKNILYVEAQKNYQLIYLKDGGSQKTRMTVSELFEFMKEREEFVRVGASYILNLDYTIKVTSKDIEIIGGKRIAVPRGAYSTLKEQYLDYYA